MSCWRKRRNLSPRRLATSAAKLVRATAAATMNAALPLPPETSHYICRVSRACLLRQPSLNAMAGSESLLRNTQLSGNPKQTYHKTGANPHLFTAGCAIRISERWDFCFPVPSKAFSGKRRYKKDRSVRTFPQVKKRREHKVFPSNANAPFFQR